VKLEKKYALDACPEGIVGINAEQFSKYVEYIADRRLERIGLPKVYFTLNPFP
jgi:ribonucleoside-diphosphate reductase beta chain